MIEPRRRRRRIRNLAAVLLCLLGLALLGRPLFHLARHTWTGSQPPPTPPPGYADDVSRMNRTRVQELWAIPADPAAAEQQLKDLLLRAQAAGLRVSIAGARHSMGGHTLYPDGIVVNMLPFRAMKLDQDRRVLQVGAGALWSDIIPFLDSHGLSVAVMQSDNSFTVGGSLSVNCHGWQYGSPPIASTVESFRLMKADGAVVRCSRSENPELFSLALGGYGLFGIILDAELRVVPNERLRLEQQVVPIAGSLARFEAAVRQKPGVRMVYARLNAVPATLFEEVIINLFYPDPAGQAPALAEPGLLRLKRAVFRGSAANDYGKALRWTAETRIQPHISGTVFSRNQLLNESADWYLDRSTETTDILHEYFLPRPRAAQFLDAARRILRAHSADLLNVTVRDVDTDTDTFLRYAPEPMIAFVMFFSQARSPEGDARMQIMTRELIDAALNAGGRYYLPYRPHATPAQFARAYPQARDFFERKRHHDPRELFQNQFYTRYNEAARPPKP